MDFRAGFRTLPSLFTKFSEYQVAQPKRANWARLGFYFTFLLVAGHGAEKVVCNNETQAKLDAHRNANRKYVPYWIAAYNWNYKRV